MNDKDLSFLDMLAIASFIVGIKNYEENLTQTDKTEILKALDKQTQEILAEIKNEIAEIKEVIKNDKP